MTTAILPNASQAVRDLNPDFFGTRDGVPNMPAPPRPPPMRGAKPKERDFQAEAERWLIARGYGRRTSTFIQAGTNGKWFVHFPRTKGNPIVLDLILMDSHTGSYREIELKVQGGNVSPDQRALVTRGEGDLCWTMEDFTENVQRWEHSIKARQGE